MLRVVGITLDHKTNYGSCLQAYALAHAVESMEIGGEACSYRLIPITKTPEWAQCVKRSEGPASLVRRLERTAVGLGLRLHWRQFAAFYREKIRFVSLPSAAALPALNELADAFVCGSDVIWNPTFTFHMGAFYLDFARKYKFSYAASFGRAEIPDSEIEEIRENLLALDGISCREETGCAVIRERIGAQARPVLDPVLLLDRGAWDQVAEKGGGSGKTIFVYVTHLNETIKRFVADLKRRTGLKVIYSAAGPKQCLQLGVLQVQKPERWLRQLRDAEYVVTNSFHATAFAVLYHKKFFTVVQGDKGKGIYVRMDDFLKKIGLEDRICNRMPETPPLGEIDYGEADRAIERLRADSLAFLRENLEAAYRRKTQAEEGVN